MQEVTVQMKMEWVRSKTFVFGWTFLTQFFFALQKPFIQINPMVGITPKRQTMWAAHEYYLSSPTVDEHNREGMEREAHSGQ